MNAKPIIILATLGCAAIFSGCGTTAPTPPQTTKVRCTVPVITRMAETKESQDKGGVVIGVVPALYKGVRVDKVTLEQAEPPPDFTIIFGPPRTGQVFVKETVVPGLRTQPSRLQFSVRINNNLARVFRGQGAVVQYNIGGKLIPFDKTDYRAFVNAIVPPRNEMTIEILGPSLDALGEKGTIGIFIYDVVTAMDDAGRIIEKQNYEWYFDYTTKVLEESVEIKPKSGWMSIAEYQQRKMREQQEQAMQQQQEAISKAMEIQQQMQVR